LKQLIRAGAMPRLTALWGELLGDCSMIAAAMMADLRDDGRHHGWAWLAGDCISIGNTTGSRHRE
jgi:hypothetical protein